MPASWILSTPSFIELSHCYCQHYHDIHFLWYFLTKEISKSLVEPNSLILYPWIKFSPKFCIRDNFDVLPVSFFLENNQPPVKDVSKVLLCFCSDPWKHPCQSTTSNYYVTTLCQSSCLWFKTRIFIQGQFFQREHSSEKSFANMGATPLFPEVDF